MEPQPAFSPDNSPEARRQRKALDYALAWVELEHPFIYPKVTEIHRSLTPTTPIDHFSLNEIVPPPQASL